MSLRPHTTIHSWALIFCFQQKEGPTFCSEPTRYRGLTLQGSLCCSVLQCVAVRCSVLQPTATQTEGADTLWGANSSMTSVLQCVAVCCSTLQHRLRGLKPSRVPTLQGSLRCSVLQCVSVCRSLSQCIAVCCNTVYTIQGVHISCSVYKSL